MKRIFHITNGDYLAYQLEKTSVEGEIIVCREALVLGNLKAYSLEDFWKVRAESVLNDYTVEKKSYYQKVFPEFEKMLNIPEGSEVNLWFEDDLFCKVNMWFCLSILPENKNLTIYRILPKADEKDHWKGFSASTNSNLEKSFSSKILFDKNDIDLGIDLWKAYQENNKELLSKLSENQSICFPFLKDVIHAYLTINPENFIKNLIENGTTDFNEIFEKFRDELGILGFGDLQVKVIYDKISAGK